ncbi:type VI immunity family protein [Pseudogulbenkiania subflava]|uniref:DUF3396 domain-containing protein n=1 Tax=Pseudogulbenkiania subflava DSM 22618 TaxID=1123014 RepID=A0A1Y6BI92_9NEIS|nr:type VI immunity family protein [Pseudogulbenkiania subflava]SMF13115.1 Protein of unknown function [Pseudogulbenkiania subflava DSM 22618]
MTLDDDLLMEWADEYRAGDFKLSEIYHGNDDAGNEIWLHWGLQIGLSLYFHEGNTLAKREIVCQLAEIFQNITGDALQLVNFGRGGTHRLGTKYGLIRGEKENWESDKTFFLELSSGAKRETITESTNFSLSACVRKHDCQALFEMQYPMYSYLRLQCPVVWFAEGTNRQALLALFRRAVVELNAEQGYGGISWSLPIENASWPDFEYAEHYFAGQFYGMDIDKPFKMTDGHATCWPLECGMRSPGWLTIVGPRLLARLGGRDAVTAQLADAAGVACEAVGEALWLQDGELPQLYPVEQGIPPSMTAIAEAIKPLRAETLKLISYPRWDGDEEIDHVFFNLDKCRRWLARFDRDGDWPSAEQRFCRPPAQLDQPAKQRIPGGHPCPQDGIWWTPAQPGARHHFTRGEIMPNFPGSTYGATIWYREAE